MSPTRYHYATLLTISYNYYPPINTGFNFIIYQTYLNISELNHYILSYSHNQILISFPQKMFQSPWMFLLIIVSQIHVSLQLNVCLNQSQIEQIIQSISIYNISVTLDTIENLDSSIDDQYSKISKIGSYEIEIQSNYKIYVGNQADNINQSDDYTGSSKNLTAGFNANNNIWLKFPNGLVTIECNLPWAVKIGCGTFIEVHLPFHEQALVKQKIYDLGVVTNMAIENLCAGTYHIWLIYTTRIGSVVKAVKPIFISYPFCEC